MLPSKQYLYDSTKVSLFIILTDHKKILENDPWDGSVLKTHEEVQFQLNVECSLSPKLKTRENWMKIIVAQHIASFCVKTITDVENKNEKKMTNGNTFSLFLTSFFSTYYMTLLIAIYVLRIFQTNNVLFFL